MQRANAALERERQAGKLGERDIEALGDEEGGYIQMDLGLGVLEEKGGEGGSESGSGNGSEGEGGSESEDNGEDNGGTGGGDGEVGRKRAECGEGVPRVGGRGRRKERSVLGRLMGGEGRRARPGIEVL
jgi:hypothetical protein